MIKTLDVLRLAGFIKDALSPKCSRSHATIAYHRLIEVDKDRPVLYTVVFL